MKPRKQIRMIDVYPSYKGGHTAVESGYVFEFAPRHPKANLWGYVAQHRLVMEDILGRHLRSGEVVHHKDHSRTNNAPDNLQLMSKSEHHRHHAADRAAKNRKHLTEEMVREALRGRTTKQAAKLLGVNHQTLRNHFDYLLRKRKSPARIDDTGLVEKIRPLAADPNIGYKNAVAQLGISAMTILRICDRHGILWVGKTRKGEKRRPYRRKERVGPDPRRGKPRPPRTDDAQILAVIRILAPDPRYSLQDVADRTGVAPTTVAKICEREGIRWVNQYRRYEKRKQYQRRKPTPLQLEARAAQTESASP